MKVETSSLEWFASFSPMVRFGFRPAAESELRHWPNVTRDVVFLHRPDACTTGFLVEFGCKPRLSRSRSASCRKSSVKVEEFKPPVGRFIFSDGHSVILLVQADSSIWPIVIAFLHEPGAGITCFC